jgi:hypothetical protein
LYTRTSKENCGLLKTSGLRVMFHHSDTTKCINIVTSLPPLDSYIFKVGWKKREETGFPATPPLTLPVLLVNY